jgi:hypothetical protein
MYFQLKKCHFIQKKLIFIQLYIKSNASNISPNLISELIINLIFSLFNYIFTP